MGLISTISKVLQASSQPANRGEGSAVSAGAYWCHDCSERIRDVADEGDGPPDSSDCGEGMTVERSAASTGCAC